MSLNGITGTNNIVTTMRKVAEFVSDKRSGPRKTTLSNVDVVDNKVNSNFDIPVGEITASSSPIITPYAGDGYGFICSPRQDQAVITLPIDSDHNRSVVLGRVFNNDSETVPTHNHGDVLLRHELGHQWSFSYTQPVTGELNLDVANQVNLVLVEEESTSSQLMFKVTPGSGTTLPAILPNELIRVALYYESTDSLYSYLTVEVEWEVRVKYNDSNEPFILISDANTVVGGPLYQTEGTEKPKHYLVEQYQEKYYAMLLSPPKGNSQFSHYMGMGLFMEEYPNRVGIGSGNTMRNDGRELANGNKPKSWTLNTDSFLDKTLDEYGYVRNFPRGSIRLKHYSQSGLLIEEKIKKTYDLGAEGDDWNQSALGMNLLLIRKTPDVPNVRELDDQEKPLGSLIIEDDCKNSYYNAVHLRLAHDNTSVQKISQEEIDQYNVMHLVEADDRIENPLPGTRPSRIQFYDLKERPTSVNLDDFKCFHDDGDKCKLNINDDGEERIKEEQQVTYGSGIEDAKLDKKKCPHWPGCTEGHYTHQNIDLPIALRNTDIRVDNIDLLMKPKANAEFVHYTNSGLFFEEQLVKDETGDVDYTKVSTYHAPSVTLRLREWDYVPKSDGTTVINYDSGSKNNAHESKRYDLCKMKLETIYGVREENYTEDSEGVVTFEDKHDTYNTATKITLAQTIYGNKIEPDDSSIQLGNRLIMEDSLEGDEPDQTVPVDIWEESTNATDSSIEGDDADMRLILPKGKLELMHYSNSGLTIQENELGFDKHKLSMDLVFNHWDTTNYRPMTPADDSLDPVGIIKWEETADSATPADSLVDFCIYHNTYRDQHLTLESPSAWSERTGAFMAIRESDNAEQNKPVLELSDSLNTMKMDAGDNKTVEIINRETQFEDEETGTNKILLDAVNKLVKVLNGNDGTEDQSIVMDKDGKSITITDSSGNTVTMDDTGIKLEAGSATVHYKKDGDINIEADGSTIDVKSGGDIDLNSPGTITIKAATEIILDSGDSGLFAPNILTNCAFTGAPHGGPIASISKLKGAGP